jgi:hypothetical protein
LRNDIFLSGVFLSGVALLHPPIRRSYRVARWIRSWSSNMKLAVAVLGLVGLVVSGNAVLAQTLTADDVKWINQCITDNRGGASNPIIRKYCFCVNERMGNNETRSITEWEKTNPAARAACDRESGWK